MEPISQDDAKADVHIGNNVRRIREILGFKQDVLIKATNLTQQSVSNYEQKAKIPNKILNQFAEALGVTPEIIENFEEERTLHNFEVMNDVHPIDKIVRVLETILKNDQETIASLKKMNQYMDDLRKLIDNGGTFR